MLREAPVTAGPQAVLPPLTSALDARPYATFWTRFFAAVIDGVLLSFVAYGAAWFATFLISQDAQQGSTMLGTMAPPGYRSVITVCQWLYEAVFLSSHWQATLGRRVLHIKVTDMEGRRISFGRATGRFLLKYLSALPLMIGYLIQPFTQHQQTLHDILTKCVVVDEGSASSGQVTTISLKP